MSTRQPEWKLLANLGDVHPIDYGGYFVYEDATGVYPAEAELLESPDSDEGVWTVYRFTLERCTLVNGVLSDNKFHPEHAAWFAQPECGRANRPQDTTYLSNIANLYGMKLEEMQRLFISDSPVERAHAYRAVGEFHGFENLDSYPMTFKNRAEVEARYK
jgi:hypothetical protein